MNCLRRSFCLRIAIACNNITKAGSFGSRKTNMEKKKAFLHVYFPEEAFLALFFSLYSLTLGDTDSWGTDLVCLPLTFSLYIYFCHGEL